MGKRSLSTAILVGLAGVGVAGTLPACSSTTAVRTGSTKHKSTNWRDVQVLTVRPERSFEEIGTLNTSGWKQKDTKKLYEDLRKQAAKMGANAVLVTETGVAGLKEEQWLRAAAIRYGEAGDGND
jgi:hypothetical protein